MTYIQFLFQSILTLRSAILCCYYSPYTPHCLTAITTPKYSALQNIHLTAHQYSIRNTHSATNKISHQITSNRIATQNFSSQHSNTDYISLQLESARLLKIVIPIQSKFLCFRNQLTATL